MEDTNTPTATRTKNNGGSVGGEKQQMKRDEWSEVAVTSLLEAYEAKWVLRNRAKLKGQDWAEVAHYVSSTTPHSLKTQTQCKNKIESMKKRYRSESSDSIWPLYQRIHLLLTRGQKKDQADVCQFVPPIDANSALLQTPSPVPFPVQLTTGQNQNAASASAVLPPKEEDGAKTTHSDQERQQNTMTTGSTSTNPAFNIRRGNKLRPSSSNSCKRKKKKKNGMQSCGIVIAESIRWLGEAMIRAEEARRETMTELVKMRAETEIRREEMQLKRTQIIADTQLEIARLMSGKGAQEPAIDTTSSQPGPS